MNILLRTATLASCAFPAVVSGYPAPFLTSADLRIYFTDTHGIVHSDGKPVVFYYRNVERILAEGGALRQLRSGRNWVQVEMPAGEHEVRVQGSGSMVDPGPMAEPARAGDVIASTEELTARAKTARPGDTLVICNGAYADWRTSIACKGIEGKPITIRPETPGGVMFRLKTRIDITGDWVVFRGFRFEHCYHNALNIRGGSHNRITQCQFFHCGSPHSTFGHILRVDMGAHYNRVDHCYFTGSKSMGIGQRNDQRHPENVGTHNRYDHNIFRDITRIWINGQENIQLGQGVPWDAELKALVEYNLFDNAWGDGEIFSSKTSRNTFRHNVAANCPHSAFTLRGGDDAVVDGNILVNNGGGIRIFGRNHRIVNNLIMDCNGAAITFRIGHERGRSKGFPATNCLIANNTLINNSSGVVATTGTDREDWRPRRNRIINNVFIAPWGIFNNPNGHVDPVADRNLFWSTGSAEIGMQGTRALVADPQLVGEGASVRLAAGSPAIDRGVPLRDVAEDRHGNPRPLGAAPDLGADEYVPQAQRAAKRLLPFIPTPRRWSIDFYKGRLLFALDDTLNAEDGTVTRKGGDTFWRGELPDSFVAEWEYQPARFSSKGSIAFCGTDGTDGYRLTWGGAAKDGKPSGIVTFEKNRVPLAQSPDTVYYRRNYIPSFPNRMVAIRASEPNPELWYHCRLIRWHNEVRFILNTAARVSKGKPRNVRDVPVVIWEDTGDVAGPVLPGGRLAFSQQGAGVWRNFRIWQAEYLGEVPPSPPTRLTATARDGRVVSLSWAQGERPGRLYDVFRSTDAQFSPNQSNQLAWSVEGRGFDDIGVREKTTYHYKVRAVNLLGLKSDCISARVTTGQGGAEYLLIGAGSATSLEAPMGVSIDRDSGRKCVMTPRGAGSWTKDPPAKGNVQYPLAVSEPGRYRIWARVIAPTDGSNSFYVVMDALNRGKPSVCHLRPCQRWQWRALGGTRTVYLEKGKHTIRLLPRESGTKIIRLLATDDLEWQPTGQ